MDAKYLSRCGVHAERALGTTAKVVADRFLAEMLLLLQDHPALTLVAIGKSIEEVPLKRHTQAGSVGKVLQKEAPVGRCATESVGPLHANLWHQRGGGLAHMGRGCLQCVASADHVRVGSVDQGVDLRQRRHRRNGDRARHGKGGFGIPSQERIQGRGRNGKVGLSFDHQRLLTVAIDFRLRHLNARYRSHLVAVTLQSVALLGKYQCTIGRMEKSLCGHNGVVGRQNVGNQRLHPSPNRCETFAAQGRGAIGCGKHAQTIKERPLQHGVGLQVGVPHTILVDGAAIGQPLGNVVGTVDVLSRQIQTRQKSRDGRSSDVLGKERILASNTHTEVLLQRDGDCLLVGKGIAGLCAWCGQQYDGSGHNRTAFDPAEQDVQAGHHNQREHRGEHHSSHNHHAQTHTGLRGCSQRERNRQGTKNRCSGCHQDRAEPHRSGLNRRIVPRRPTCPELIGKLYDQDAVLRYNADQNDGPDLAEDVQRLTQRCQRDHGTGQGQRHGEHDDQRINETLKLGRQHKVDQYESQQEGEHNARRALLEVQGRSRQRRGKGVVEYLSSNAIHLGDAFVDRHAGCQARTDRSTHGPIVVVELWWCTLLGDGHKVGELNQRSIAGLDGEFHDLVGCHALPPIDFANNVVLTATTQEVSKALR